MEMVEIQHMNKNVIILLIIIIEFIVSTNI